MKKLLIFLVVIFCFVDCFSQEAINENFLSNVGDTVVVLGKIYNGAFLVHVKTKPTFLNLGDTSPSHRVIVRIEPEDRNKFPAAPETFFLNKIVEVTGKLQEYKGSALIQVSEPGMIKAHPFSDSTVYRTKIDLKKNLKRTNQAELSKITPTVITPSLRMIVPDSVLQPEWIKSVTKKSFEESKKNIRLVEKDMDLRTAPFSDAPVLAELKPGMLVSVLYTANKWCYISIGTIDGFYNVNGFIKHRKFKYLKRTDLL